MVATGFGTRSWLGLAVLLLGMPADRHAEVQADIVPDGPIVVTRGGTYRGRWRSLEAETPAVTIRTSEPVFIEDSLLEGRTHLIKTDAAHAVITVRNCTGRGLDPGVAGRCPGRFLEAESFDSVVVRNNLLEGTAGIYLRDYEGPGGTAPTVQIIGNRARNIDGRKSNGRGGFLDFNDRRRHGGGRAESGYEIVQFLQLDKVRNVPGMEVAWNEVINEPERSRVEDNINVYLSSGTAASPIRIHDNYIQGGYTIRPWQRDTNDADWEYDWSYSGGGILLGDGSSHTVGGAAAHVLVEDNQVVATSNYGIAIAAGHDHTFARNRIVACGLLPDGRPIAAQNVGAYIWDSYHDKEYGSFFNNRGHDNLIGWVGKDGSRNDWWRPDASSWVNNTRGRGPITPRTEAAEFASWRKKVEAAGVTIGPKGGG